MFDNSQPPGDRLSQRQGDRPPGAYLEYLGPGGQSRVYQRTRRAYATAPNKDDCVQDAMLIIQNAKRPLRSAPPFDERSEPNWHERAEDALVGYVTSHRVRKRLIDKEIKANRVVAIPNGHKVRNIGHLSGNSHANDEAERTAESFALNKSETKVVSFVAITGRSHRTSNGDVFFDADADLNAEEIAPDREGAPSEMEKRMETLQIREAMKLKLEEECDDPLVLALFHQLLSGSSGADDIFRGEKMQIDNLRLLETLQGVHPEQGWTMQSVHNKFATLCRTARSWNEEKKQ